MELLFLVGRVLQLSQEVKVTVDVEPLLIVQYNLTVLSQPFTPVYTFVYCPVVLYGSPTQTDISPDVKRTCAVEEKFVLSFTVRIKQKSNQPIKKIQFFRALCEPLWRRC